MNVTFIQPGRTNFCRQQPGFKSSKDEDFSLKLNEPVLTIEEKKYDLSLQAFDAVQNEKYFEAAGLKWVIGKILERQGRIEEAEKVNSHRDKYLNTAFEKAEI